MPLATFRGEKTIEAFVERQYNRLTDRQRDHLIKAILKANPRMKNLNSVKKGAVIVLPDVTTVRKKLAAAADDPDKEVLERISLATRRFGEEEIERRKQATETLKTEMREVKSAAFRRLVQNSPELTQLANQATASLEGRIRNANDARKALEDALKAARDDLEDRPV